MTPLLLKKIVWAGSNLGSYDQACQALRELLDVELVAKQSQRITSQVGSEAVTHRQELVEQHQSLPLVKRVECPPSVPHAELAVVMMDGGRHQRRDHFQPRAIAPTEPVDATAESTADALSTLAAEAQTSPAAPATDQAVGSRKKHWREDKVGIVLSMQSKVHECDPTPEFPEWLARAEVVCQLAHLTVRDELPGIADDLEGALPTTPGEQSPNWPDIAPRLKSREVIASIADAEAFGQHLEWKAWTMGVPNAPRRAFVADGQAVNWTIHQRHFSQMTGILDLMHALSYAWRAGEVLEDPQAYRRFATWIWGGQVALVIAELRQHQQRLGLPEKGCSASDPRERIARALTYYENHQHLMNYPAYRQEGLPLTSSHMESTVKLINQRVKGTEKFWRADNAESLLQLRADSLSESKPLEAFWNHWQTLQTGANHYRKTAV